MNQLRDTTTGGAWMSLVALLGLLATPALAGMTTGTDSGSAPQCDPTTGTQCADNVRTGPDGNPKDCIWIDGQTGADMLMCIGDQLCGEDPDGDGLDLGVSYGQVGDLPLMDFWLDPSPGCNGPGTGPEEEIFSYCLREDGDVIGYAHLEVDQPNLVAKIRHFVEPPHRSGAITVGINEEFAVVDVASANGDVGKLNKALCLTLTQRFQAVCFGNFVVVFEDSDGDTPRAMSLETAGSGVSTTEIALEPHGGPLDVTACSEASPYGMTQVPR